jgi:hypothetical protein
VEAWKSSPAASDVIRLQEIALCEWQAIWEELIR